jgi:hypothetical protein
MVEVIEVQPADEFRLFLRFKDGVSGVVDLSSYAGRGVFSAWHEPGFFQKVKITHVGALEWPTGIDLCPDALYMRMTGKKPEDLFPSLIGNLAHA